jgi:hypothetical protein
MLPRQTCREHCIYSKSTIAFMMIESTEKPYIPPPPFETPGFGSGFFAFSEINF